MGEILDLNGKKANINDPSIPSVGQAPIHDWNLTLSVGCPNCKRVFMIQGKPGAMQPCDCGWVCQLGPFALNKTDMNQLHVQLNFGMIKK